MSESRTTEIATEIAAILDTYTLRQRELAIAQQHKGRLALTRNVGEGLQVSYEIQVEDGADVAEIYGRLATVDKALDRLKAKSDLSDHYFRILNKCGEIELAMTNLARESVRFEADRVARNANRRVARLEPTDQQKAALQAYRKTISEGFERITELQKAIAECRRVFDGEDPFAVLAEQIAARVDKLRGVGEKIAA
jgi:hypothetical protein